MNKLQSPRGTYDALPEKSERFRYIEEIASNVLRCYGYGEIRTPIFEAMDVFARNVGDETDIVSKEMYVFEDRGGDKMALRPEGTASIVRAYYTNGLKQYLPLKLCYINAPMFRYERPQKLRYRQHHQIGVEMFGYSSANADVEIIATGFALLKALNIDDSLYVQINSLGNSDDRERYRTALLDYFMPYKDELSYESKIRLEKNPLRVLDSKEPEDKEFVKNAPNILDYLCEESATHFKTLKAGLDNLGIAYEVNPFLVRGLDYYTHTVFEIHSSSLGAQSQVLSGGRYDGLIAKMGGDSVAGVGFGVSIERLEALMPEINLKRRPISFAIMAENAYSVCMSIAEKLRSKGLVVNVPLDKTSFKAQMKRANKLNSCYTIVVGTDELAKGVFQLKDMDTSQQQELDENALIAYLAKERF